MRSLIAVFSSLAVISSALAHDEGAQATYLGNEGVLVARGDTKILFDAFYAQSYGQYALVPDEIATAMLNGQAPYDGIDAIFVSHVHGDHFSPEPAVAYLRAHRNVRLFGTKQVEDAIAAASDSDASVMKRVTGLDLSPTDEISDIEIDIHDRENLLIEVVAIPHAGNRPDIQNFAWRVTLDNKTTVLHLGDAGPVVADFSRHRAHFSFRKSDAAFPPYWFFGNDDGEHILETIIAADQAIGVHVPARAAGNGDKWREDAGGDLFTDPGETRDIAHE